MKLTLLTLAAAFALEAATLAGPMPDHTKTLVLKNKQGAAILGYDPVAYFTDNKPVKGDPKFRSNHEGADYYFASAAHQALFDANPMKYAPAYGGYCGYAASINRLSPISPEWFQIVDGRLILQHNQKAYDKFHADLRGNIQKADRNWPGLVERETAKLKASSRFPLTWPGFYDYSGRRSTMTPVAGGSLAAHSSVGDRMPMPGDLDWPGF